MCPVFVAVLVLFACGGCSRSSNSGKPELHALDWKNYDGCGDPRKAVFLLDGKEIGVGNRGFEIVKHVLATWPKNTTLKIDIREAGPCDPTLALITPYPFSKEELEYAAYKAGVKLQWGEGPIRTWEERLADESPFIVVGRVLEFKQNETGDYEVNVEVIDCRKGKIPHKTFNFTISPNILDRVMLTRHIEDAVSRTYCFYMKPTDNDAVYNVSVAFQEK